MVPAMVDPDGPLTDWHNRLFLLLAFLNDRELAGAGVTLDYSRSSLVALERAVLDQFAHPAQVAWATRRTFVEGLTAYLGETLMRRVGERGRGGRSRRPAGRAVGCRKCPPTRPCAWTWFRRSTC